MTGWLASTETGTEDHSAGTARRLSDTAAYRGAVASVLAELTRNDVTVSLARAERLLDRRLADPAFAAVLSATPSGPDDAIQRILRDIRGYRRSPNAPADLAAMIRITLLTQIDVLWWGHVPPFKTDDDMLAAPELLQLDGLRYDGRVTFRYRRQVTGRLAKAARLAQRATAPGRAPGTAGLRFAAARAELIVVLNRIAADFGRVAPGAPGLWVTSLTRSVAEQRQLRSRGHAAALLPSAHCVGYAADVEMAWLRKFGADQLLQGVLLAHQRDGDINVIDEGQAWHVCVRPGAGRALQLIPRQR